MRELMQEQILTSLQAFKVMTNFLDDYYLKTLSDDVAVLWGGIQFCNDGGTMDPSFLEDWEEVLASQKSLTITQAYMAAQKFIDMYATRISSKDLKHLLTSMELLPQGGSRNPEMWQKWVQMCDVALKNE
jgi:hypothetical protein